MRKLLRTKRVERNAMVVEQVQDYTPANTSPMVFRDPMMGVTRGRLNMADGAHNVHVYGNMVVDGDLLVTGDLTVSGTMTTTEHVTEVTGGE